MEKLYRNTILDIYHVGSCSVKTGLEQEDVFQVMESQKVVPVNKLKRLAE